MRLELHAPDQTGIPKLRAYVKQRLELVLGRYGDRVGSVTVWLQNLDGPRGDRRCFARIQLRHKDDISVEADADEMEEAINFVAERVGRSVRRALHPLNTPPAAKGNR